MCDAWDVWDAWDEGKTCVRARARGGEKGGRGKGDGGYNAGEGLGEWDALREQGLAWAGERQRRPTSGAPFGQRAGQGGGPR